MAGFKHMDFHNYFSFNPWMLGGLHHGGSSSGI